RDERRRAWPDQGKLVKSQAGKRARSREFEESSMSMSDPIADLLTRIRNAQMAGKPNVVCPSSKIKQAILDVLKQEGYIAGYSISSDVVKPELIIDLKYYNGRPVIEELHRGSSPGLRNYKGC